MKEDNLSEKEEALLINHYYSLRENNSPLASALAHLIRLFKKAAIKNKKLLEVRDYLLQSERDYQQRFR